MKKIINGYKYDKMDDFWIKGKKVGKNENRIVVFKEALGKKEYIKWNMKTDETFRYKTLEEALTE